MRTEQDINAALRALYNFTSYLASSIETNPDIDTETRDELRSLIPVFEAYGSELERRLEARPATPIFYRWLMLASLEAIRIQHYLLTTFPRLADYRPVDKPSDVPQETIKHLHDAVEMFNEAKSEFAQYLPPPRFAGMVERLAEHCEPEQVSRWDAENTSIINDEIRVSTAMNRDWNAIQGRAE